MENAAVGMSLVGPDRTLIYVNGAFAAMLRVERGDCLGRDLADFVHPECDAALVLHIDRLLARESSEYRGECRLRTAWGDPLWVLASASELRADQAGTPDCVVLQVVDIDRQKRAEAALVYSENRWNFALEAAGQGVWDYDARRKDMFYSSQWRRMRGIPLDEYVDPDQEAWLARLHPDDERRIRADIHRQNQGEDGFDTLEYRERHRDGHWIWILSRGRPVEWDADGKPLRTIGTDTDITHLKKVEAELAAEKERLRVTLESIADGVIATGADNRISFMNPVAESMTGWQLREAAERPLDEVFLLANERTGLLVPSLVRRCIEAGETTYLDEESVALVARDGTLCDIRASAAPLRTPAGELVGAVLVFQDMTQSRALQRQLAHSASHDALTGLANRAAFEKSLTTIASEALATSRRHALCFIDLDRFKQVNDNAGHVAGDALLRIVADVIRRNCRRNDLAARIGGDEFVLILSDCDLTQAELIAGKLVEAVARIRFVWNGRAYQIGASIGITPVDGTALSPLHILSRADSACYAAKAAGRGRVAVKG